MLSDTQGLIKQEPVSEPQALTQLVFFLILQVVQLIWCVIAGSWEQQYLVSLGLVAIAFANVFICQSTLGRALVGLSWKFTLSGVPFWSYDIEPDPFVPKKLNANCFWIGLSLAVSISVVITIRYLWLIGKSGVIALGGGMIASVVYIANLIVFFKIQKIASKATVEAVKVLLLGQTGKFPNAQEGSSDEEVQSPAPVAIEKEPEIQEKEQQPPPEEDEIV